MKMETRTYILTGVEPMLGSNPSDPEIRARYIESKKPVEVTEDESGNTPEKVDENYGLTVFLLHPKTGGPMLYDYVIRGFLKEALANLAGQLGVTNARSKVDKFLFVGPRHIPLLNPDNMEPVKGVDGVYERSLRAQTAQGPRVTLAGSETVDEWMIKIDLTLIDNDAQRTKGSALSWEAVEEALDYGRFQGLGQFRNGGFGRFTWERAEEQEKPKRKGKVA